MPFICISTHLIKDLALQGTSLETIWEIGKSVSALLYYLTDIGAKGA
jgi:hypothetical protein